MKRILLSIVLIFALLMTFVACNNVGKTVCDTLNEMTKQSYSKIQLNITTFTGDIELKANYTLTADKVDYSIEQLNLLPSDGDISDISEEYKTMVSGTATIEGDKITKQNDDAVTIPKYDELKGNFNFKERYFENIKVENERFSADVTSVYGFLGTNEELSDIKLVVEYGENALKTITIVYKTDSSTVTSVYLFEK